MGGATGGTSSHRPCLTIVRQLSRPMRKLLIFTGAPTTTGRLSHRLAASNFKGCCHTRTLNVFRRGRKALRSCLMGSKQAGASHIYRRGIPGTGCTQLRCGMVRASALPSNRPFSRLRVRLSAKHRRRVHMRFTRTKRPLLKSQGCNATTYASQRLVLYTYQLRFARPAANRGVIFRLWNGGGDTIVKRSLRFSFHLFPVCYVDPTFA